VKTVRRIGLSLLLMVGAVGLIATSFADFNAQTTNSSTFTSGTLVLSDAKTGGTTCLSTGGASTDTNSNATGCDNLINAATTKPGDTPTPSIVTIRNVGSLAASALQVYSASCASANAAAETYHGTGDLCTAVALTLHDDTNNRCYYPTQAAGACAFNAANTLATFGASYPSGTPLALSTTGLSGGIAFSVGTQFNSTAGNSMQGRTATIDLTWKITQ
jgi:hypothetical protein